jgi:hypothetical protein
MVTQNGYSSRTGYEPGTHHRAERVDDYGHGIWMSPVPNLDLKHKHNLTPTRWDRSQWRNQKFTEGWTESDHVDPWYKPGELGRLLAI